MARIPAGVNSGTDPDFGVYSLTNAADFYMEKYEVTKALWDEVKNWNGGNGYTDLPSGGGKASTHPVHTVSWYACVKWCNARSEKEGRVPVYYTDAGFTQIYKTGNVSEPFVKTSDNGYRLPTAEQWEYAARGGVSGRRFPWGGDTINHVYVNYRANGDAYAYDISPYTSFTYHPDYSDGSTPYTSPVGVVEAGRNAYGLYDMAGNVWEWCYDWYPGFEGSSRMRRGGGWDYYAYYCRVAYRDYGGPAYGYSIIGFRAVLPPGQ